jgi:hypothetical protein
MKPYYDLCNTDKSVIEKAELILSGNIEVFGKTFNFDYKKDWLKDPVSENFWNKNKFFSKAPYIQNGCSDVKYVLEINKMNHLVCLAHAYFCTKKEKYIDGIEKQIAGWLECVPYEKSVANRIMMDLGFRAVNLIQISLLCADSMKFTKKIHPKIISILSAHEFTIRKFSTPRWFKTGNGDNHVTGEMVGLLVTQLWLHHFVKKNYTKYYKQEIKYLINILNETIAPSGAYLEQSANYARVVSEFLIILDLFIKNFQPSNNHIIRYCSFHYLERLLYYLKNLSYNAKLPNFGDNDNARVLLPMIRSSDCIDYVTSYIDKMDYRFDILKRSDYLDGSQWIYHSKDNNKAYLFTRIGKLSYMKEGAGTHAHNDLLSVIMFVRGSYVFIDKGCSFYNMGNNIRKADISTSSHNTVTIDGIEMAEPLYPGYKDYPLSNCTKNDMQNDSCFFAGYLQYKEIVHKREIHYENSSFIINDIVTMNNNSKYATIKFLLGEQLTVIEKKRKACLLNDNNNKNEFEIIVSGIHELNVKEVKYYPRYGEESKTLCLYALAEINNIKKIRIKTTIKILKNG